MEWQHLPDVFFNRKSMINYWLVKSDPEEYGWENLLQDKNTSWTGVRNFAARNHLRAMKKGDHVLFYHSQSDKAVVGISKVVKEHFPDKTASEGDWSAVEIAAMKPLKNPVTLARIKTEKKLKDIALIRQSRLSVMPLTKEEFDMIVNMGK